MVGIHNGAREAVLLCRLHAVDEIELEGAGWAHAHAGRQQPGFHPSRALVALMHLLLGVIAGDAEGTRHGTAMTTNAERPVDANRSARAVLGDGASRASHHARRVFAMHTGGREV